MKLQGIRQMKYRMLPGSDLSGFQGWLPFPEELEDEKGLFLCIYKTENGKQKKYEEKLETFPKTYGMMAVGLGACGGCPKAFQSKLKLKPVN